MTISGTTYKWLQVENQTPSGAAGAALQSNFQAIADAVGNRYNGTAHPNNNWDGVGTASPSNIPFYAGSEVYDSSDGSLWKCISNATGSAVWIEIDNTAILNELGANSGIATLNSSGQLTSSQVPTSIVGAVVYQGLWNATTNTPTLVSSTGSKGNYYITSVAGTTSINGIATWNVGDTIIFDGSTWNKIDGISSEVVSVAGRTGAVVLSDTDISGLANSATITADTAATPSTIVERDDSGSILCNNLYTPTSGIANIGQLAVTGPGIYNSIGELGGDYSLFISPGNTSLDNGTITTNGIGTITAVGFTGSGSGLTSLNASNVSSGTLGTSEGGTGVSTGLTALNASNLTSGTAPVAHGGTGTTTAFTQGSVVFAGASGVYSQDNSNLSWDDVSKRLGIGTATPGTNAKITINPNNTADTLATAQINTSVATNKGLVVQGFTSQSANLQEWQDHSGSVLAYIDSTGSVRQKNSGTAINAPFGGNQTIAIGSTGSNYSFAIVIGGLAAATANYATAIGAESTCGGQYGLAMGLGANCSAVNGTAIGSGANCSGTSGFAFGHSATASGAYDVVVGNNLSSSTHTPVVMLGNNSTSTITATASNQFWLMGYLFGTMTSGNFNLGSTTLQSTKSVPCNFGGVPTITTSTISGAAGTAISAICTALGITTA